MKQLWNGPSQRLPLDQFQLPTAYLSFLELEVKWEKPLSCVMLGYMHLDIPDMATEKSFLKLLKWSLPMDTTGNVICSNLFVIQRKDWKELLGC